tara:strand:- start:345 stop:641 length:297 start_codon:yes stop_codon:yes gene_type:complete
MSTSMQKKKMLKTLSEYYIKKGKVYDSSLEYGRQTDTPYSIKEIKKIMGGWGMLFKYLNTEYPDIEKDIKKDKEPVKKPVFPKSRIPSPPKPSTMKFD